MTVVYFVIVLGVLIFIHELGHFILAKRAGIRVDVFSLGFGFRLFGVKIGETDYRISAFPLGGYVSMRGEDPTDEHAADPDSFSSKSVWTRMKVVCAGPAMNFLLCLVLMPIVFMIGRTEPTYLHDPTVVIGVKEDSPAKIAGIMKGDKIIAIDGKKVDNWADFMERIAISAGQNVRVSIDRAGVVSDKNVPVAQMEDMRGGFLGVEPPLLTEDAAKVDTVASDGAAAKAGILPGDVIVSFAGRAISNIYDLTSAVNMVGNKESPIVVQRGSEKLSLKVTPAHSAKFNSFMIGIGTNRVPTGPEKVYRYGFVESINKGFKETMKMARMTVDVFYRLITLKLSFNALGGPIVIAKVSAAAASMGLANFLYFMAFLSVQLSILNLLPIPVLDGGHVLFLGIEAIKRKPVSIKVRAVATQIGFFLLIALMSAVTIKDVETVWNVSAWFKGFFK